VKFGKRCLIKTRLLGTKRQSRTRNDLRGRRKSSKTTASNTTLLRMVPSPQMRKTRLF